MLKSVLTSEELVEATHGATHPAIEANLYTDSDGTKWVLWNNSPASAMDNEKFTPEEEAEHNDINEAEAAVFGLKPATETVHLEENGFKFDVAVEKPDAKSNIFIALGIESPYLYAMKWSK